MRNQPSDHLRKRALMKRWLSNLEQLLQSGKFRQLSAQKRKTILSRIRRLIRQLRPDLGTWGLKPILASALMALGIWGGKSMAQNFGPVQVNPFNLDSLPDFEAKPCFADIDDDGDLDMFVGDSEGQVNFFENIGNANTPLFDTATVNPFGITGANYYVQPALKDIDADGDYDLFLGDGDPISVYFFENVGDSVNPAFGPAQISPFGISFASFQYMYEAKPTLADLDNDGDFDLLCGTAYYGELIYFQNTGQDTAPAFAAPIATPFGLAQRPDYASTTFADLDKDSDYDILVYDNNGVPAYFENIGDSVTPNYTTPVLNAFGIANSNYYSGSCFADLDGDGDLDLMVGDSDGNFRYQEDTTGGVTAFAPLLIGLNNDTICGSDTLDLDFIAYDANGDSIVVAATSTNQSVIADADISINGLPIYLDLTAITTAPGNTSIIVTADDGNVVVADTFDIFVEQCTNAAPVITGLMNDSICELDTLELSFMADDANGDPLTVTGVSTNQAVIADANIMISGTPPNYDLSATTSGQGSTMLIVTADDGSNAVSDTINVEVEDCGVAIGEGFFAERFQLFPNPAQGQVRYEISLRSPADFAEIRLLDLTGRVVRTEQFPQGGAAFDGPLDLQGLPAGVYLFELRTSLYRLHKRLVLRR